MYLLSKHWGRGGSWSSAMLSRMASLTGTHFNNSAKVISQSYNLFEIPFPRILWLFKCPTKYISLINPENKTSEFRYNRQSVKKNDSSIVILAFDGIEIHSTIWICGMTRKHSRFLVGTDSVMKCKEYMF